MIAAFVDEIIGARNPEESLTRMLLSHAKARVRGMKVTHFTRCHAARVTVACTSDGMFTDLT